MEQKNEQALPIRFGKAVGVNLNAVQGWEMLSVNVGGRLILHLEGDTIIIHESRVGKAAFLKLHQILLDRFHLDFGVENDS